MRRINSITALHRLLADQPGLYVRWSASIRMDMRRGYSLRYGREPERGLSACALDPDWPDWALLRQLQEYRRLCGGHCWLITGRVVGTGGDNEPLLQDVRPIAEAVGALVTTDWRRLEAAARVADSIRRWQHIIDPVAYYLEARDIMMYVVAVDRPLAASIAPLARQLADVVIGNAYTITPAACELQAAIIAMCAPIADSQPSA